MAIFLAYDVGTSSVKSILTDYAGKILAQATEAYPLYTPHPGWVEQNPEDYWKAICLCTRSMVSAAKIDPKDIKGIVFTTQAMGIIPVDIKGQVLYPNISWVDGRAEEQAVKAMNYLGGKRIFKLIVGAEITGKDVIPKLLWLKEKRPDIFNRTHKFLDVNGYLKYKCTGRMVAEWSGACSYAFDIKKKDWEYLFFKMTRIGTDKLPELVRSVDLVGGLTAQAAHDLGLVEGLAVYGGCDDTQSAAVGTTAMGEGEAHIYTGTSAWVGVITEKAPKFKNGVFSLQSADPDKNILVCITESAGANTGWLIDTFYPKEKATMPLEEVFQLVEKEVLSVNPGADYLLMTPWFLGERCPVSTTTTRSTLFNLTHQHGRAHIARAHFEGIAFNLKWSMSYLDQDFGFKFDTVKVTGGGSRSKAWMQIIADITGRKVITTTQPFNAGALGAAMCAMVGSGIYKDFSEISQLVQTDEVFTPRAANTALYEELFISYQSIYHQLEQPYQKINKNRF
jgi:xylulokinase